MLYNMLFRDTLGNLLELQRHGFTNDELYYKKVMDVKTRSYNAYEKLQQTTNKKTQLTKKSNHIV